MANATKRSLSRREFLSKAGTVAIGSVGIAATAGLAACTTAEDPTEPGNNGEPTDVIKWERRSTSSSSATEGLAR